MAISGVNSASIPEKPEQEQLQALADNQDDKQFSIFNTNKDGTVTVAEQQDALE